MKTPAPELAKQTGARLKAIQAELALAFDHKTIDDFADLIGESRNTVSNWLNGYNPPSIYAMIRLCDKHGFTLDWIYRGRSEGLAYDKSVRLEAFLAGVAAPSLAPAEPLGVPAAVPPEAAGRAKADRRAKASAQRP
jgi:transcriptional regulator with XRE-family HTH domain